MKIYSHGLSPLLMQNPYSKFILAIKAFIFFYRFSQFLQALLRQIEIQMLNINYFPCLPAVKNSRQKSSSEVGFYTLVFYSINDENTFGVFSFFQLCATALKTSRRKFDCFASVHTFCVLQAPKRRYTV